MLRQLAIAVVRADDWEAAVRFYRDALGLVPAEIDAEGGWARLRFPDGGATLAVMRRRSDEPQGAYLNLLSDDLEADAARFPVHEAVVPGHGYRTAWVEDASGLRLQVFSWEPRETGGD